MGQQQKSTKGTLIKGMGKNLPIEMFGDPVIKRKLRKLLRGCAGIYALYKNDRLYYVGLAQSLRSRIRSHRRDKHAGKWNRFTIFIIKKVKYLKDIETLFLNIAKPKGNRIIGKVHRKTKINRKLRKIIREYQNR